QGAEKTVANVKTKTNLNYVNIPVLLQRMFGVGFRLEAGPQIGFLVNAKNKTGSNETDVKSSFKTVDFSFPIGLGYLTKSGFGFDGRWVPGFSNIQETGATTANNVFQLGVFYQITGK
ncbi:MAG: outer membrane beta-barrel protein, partial [Ferruginibacter sp.]